MTVERLSGNGVARMVKRRAGAAVLEMPAPVVADALGYHHVTTAKLAAQAGATWSWYASGDHLRSPSGWSPRGTDDG